ncbi:HelD family protein [Streptomyces sp. WMMC905]|uniref:HelD family protein n=1 Tax=Streptomyces sp. WMMC905 TaxID=3404123 RepID=UPI003B943879
MNVSEPSPPHALALERAHHERCRTALAAMVAGADAHLATGEDVSASGADAEVLGTRLRGHARDLRELPPGPCFFGRIDLLPDAPTNGRPCDPEAVADHPVEPEDAAPTVLHIGRLRIAEGPADQPLVMDWRAPLSRAYYQATVEDPRGVVLRRRFGWSAGSLGDSADLTGIEDERLVADDTGGDTRWLREIARPRVGPMRDIVATIRPEQDDLVRADPAATLCVQGAPGTGKTAVGLHRAAYLLHTRPRRMRSGGLLVLGPHRAFVDFIAEVLPSLGEFSVRQTTLAEELARHPVTAADAPEAAALKHDPRMAEVLRRALRGRIDPWGAPELTVPDGSRRLRIPREDLARIVRGVRAEDTPYEVGRERLRARVVDQLRRSAERRSSVPDARWVRRVAASRAVAACLDAVWPAVRAERVLADLLAPGEALTVAADGILDASERRALTWAKPPRSWKSARWSAADLVLLDEIAGRSARLGGYAHVVVDEAQDLSPMECRAIGRRATGGSLTVLGDLAQGTTPWAARAWSDTLAHLGRPEAPVVALTTGFRLPRAVAEFAGRLLDRLDVDVPAPRSPREAGEVTLVRTGPARLHSGVVDAVREALRQEGSIGVIAADTAAPVLRQALSAASIPTSAPGESCHRVAVVPAGLAKGLEYDHVVAVEPAAIAEAEERGPHRLYVVLTRAVSRLTVVHARPLPF